MDSALLSLSFVQGVLAFFAPCAVSLLPGYLSVFITKNTKDKELSKKQLLRHALALSGCTVVGIVVMYIIASILIFTIAAVIKKGLVYVSMGLALFVIYLGIRMLRNKPVALSFHAPQLKANNHYIEAFLFGITYGIGALGCLFPLFLIVATAALQAETFFTGASYLLAYAVGMSLFMVLFYVIAVFSHTWLQKKLYKVLPLITRVGGVLVIVAGIYIIYYQSALL